MTLVDFMATLMNLSIVLLSSAISGIEELARMFSAKAWSEAICSEISSGSVAVRIEAMASEAARAMASIESVEVASRPT